MSDVTATARAEILDRIRRATSDRPSPQPIVRNYRTAGTTEADVELFVDRLVDYRATVHRGTPDQIEAILAARGIAQVIVPDGFDQSWLPTIGQLREPLGITELDSAAGVVTTCAVAVAETGTIVLDAGPGQGRRALSLIPDYHLVVVRAEQILASIPDAIAVLDPTRPLTWISGPSATSDIELKRVEGVHGPRTLDVLLLT
jgi:L-lactate dehydrogenase complex protein LldG